MANSVNNGGDVDESNGMVVDWRDLTKDRLVVAKLIAQQQPREELEAASEPPDDDEFRAAAAVLDALFNDTSSGSLDFQGFCTGGGRSIGDAYGWS